ncbi:MAG TPA: twin-arginine translocase TatA/TatE family subunit [Alphaproteobacteria bacterium]|jgi:sec-independent protein translocase protein TatA|nr:twin-arginine translocase TatA/TatE family subunit [Alphaproteobacteria bacterium]
MGISFWQILVVLVLVLLLFGRGKISNLMGDLAKGIKSFKRGMAEDDSSVEAKTETAKTEAVAGEDKAAQS